MASALFFIIADGACVISRCGRSAPSSRSARKAPSPARPSGKTPPNRAFRSTWRRSSASSGSSCSSARPARVTPTPAGLRYYKSCVQAVGALENAAEEARALAGQVAGELRIGLMPTFTRAVLAPVLDDFVPRCPEVRLHIVEGYSGLLTEMMLDEELDFAVVPAFEGTIGLKSRLLVRDREMLISGPQARICAAGALKAFRMQAAEIRGAGTGQYPPAQSGNLFPEPRRRGRGHAGNGRHDRHARIRRPLRLGDDPAERDLGQRHRPRRTDRQSDRGARAARRVRGDPADAAHALDAGAAVPATLRSRSRAIFTKCGSEAMRGRQRKNCAQ